MRFEIHHGTYYCYTAPVQLGLHVLRLMPRSDGSQRLLEFQIHLDPEPVVLSPCLDALGNSVIHAWFEGSTRWLRVETHFILETLRRNPYDYLLDPLEAVYLPPEYGPELQAVLMPYLKRHFTSPQDPVWQFAKTIAEEVEGQIIPFLSTLCQRLGQRVKRVVREEGEPFPPEVTLAKCEAACRDLTVLFMDACRAMGIAARFVSGYQRGDPRQPKRYLHAWPEVYLPGGGWRGFDPSSGLAVADAHVPVAAGPTPGDTMPVWGYFRGREISSQMEVRLSIQVDDKA